MIIAAAQTSPTRDNITQNIKDHIRLATIAVKKGADLILFPEMSLSSYERKKAKNLTFSENDPRLNELKKISTEGNITIISGAPIKINNKTYIGSFVISPGKRPDIYTKQFLHGEEHDYFESSCNYNPTLTVKGERISLAICADINHEQHIVNAKLNKATIYIAGIFFGDSEMNKAHCLLSGYAKTHKINVLMSNFTGDVWDMKGGGKSSFWNDNGDLVAELNETEPGILFIKKEQSSWRRLEVE